MGIWNNLVLNAAARQNLKLITPHGDLEPLVGLPGMPGSRSSLPLMGIWNPAGHRVLVGLGLTLITPHGDLEPAEASDRA